MSGVYCWGDDPDNAEYLTLSVDGSYTLRSSSNWANHQQVKTFWVPCSAGHWKASKDKILLFAADKSYFPTGQSTLLVARRGSKLELIPVFGAGWTPAQGFVLQK
jgi:hypothetical protein